VFNDDGGECESKLDEQVVETLRSLGANSFDARFAQSSNVVKGMVLSLISKDAVVSVRDSAAVRARSS
jgi:hypothetical protein